MRCPIPPSWLVLLVILLPSAAAAQTAPPDADLAATRLFFGPTGRALPAGKSYVGVFQASAPFVQGGITDRLSLGAGTPLLFGHDLSEHPFWITPKFQFLKAGRVQAAVGGIHAFTIDDLQAGLAYAVATTGSPDASVTVGAGMAYADGERGAWWMLGIEKRLSAKVRFLSESHLWSGGALLTNGVRVGGRKLVADFGMMVPVGSDVSIMAWPVVNVVYLF